MSAVAHGSICMQFIVLPVDQLYMQLTVQEKNSKRLEKAKITDIVCLQRAHLETKADSGSVF